jgi:hypothetical protein
MLIIILLVIVVILLFVILAMCHCGKEGMAGGYSTILGLNTYNFQKGYCKRRCGGDPYCLDACHSSTVRF